MGLETFFPSVIVERILRAIKYSNLNKVFFNLLSYTKLLCLKSILVIFLFSCGNNAKLNRKKAEKSKEIVEHVIQDPVETIEVNDAYEHAKTHPLIIGNQRFNLLLD